MTSLGTPTPAIPKGRGLKPVLTSHNGGAKKTSPGYRSQCKRCGGLLNDTQKTVWECGNGFLGLSHASCIPVPSSTV